MHHSKDNKEVPHVQILFDFMQEKSDTLPDVPATPQTEPKPEHSRKQQTQVHAVQS